MEAQESQSYYIKRVIGVFGDTVEIKSGKVYVNGHQLEENYLSPGTITNGSISLKVPEGKVFVLGDNRELSEDSRDPRLGPIPVKSIKGHAVYRLFQLNSMERL